MAGKSEEIVTPVEFEEVLEAQQLPDIDYDRRITFGRLLTATAAALAVPEGYASPVDLERSRPEVLVGGLYIRRQDPRHGSSHLTYSEVVFPSQEFDTVARSPHDMGEQVYGLNHKRNKSTTDRDERHATAMRAAGHVLDERLTKLNGFRARLIMREHTLSRLMSEVVQTEHPWIAHWKAGNLEAARAMADQAIHETAEVATVNLGWNHAAVEGMHRAITTVLYRPDQNLGLMRAGWRAYLKMVLDHTAAKAQLVSRSYQGCMKELETYQPFLDAEGKLF